MSLGRSALAGMTLPMVRSLIKEAGQTLEVQVRRAAGGADDAAAAAAAAAELAAAASGLEFDEERVLSQLEALGTLQATATGPPPTAARSPPRPACPPSRLPTTGTARAAQAVAMARDGYPDRVLIPAFAQRYAALAGEVGSGVQQYASVYADAVLTAFGLVRRTGCRTRRPIADVAPHLA